MFNEKYFSDAIRSSKVKEFVSLVQGKMTVMKYAQVFDILARFALELVPTARSRRDKFIRGLNSMVARDVRIIMSLRETTYAQVVERALTTERVEQHIYREHTARRETRRATQAAAESQRGGGSND